MSTTYAYKDLGIAIVVACICYILYVTHTFINQSIPKYDVNIQLLKEGLMPSIATAHSNGYDCLLDLDRFNEDILGDKIKYCRSYNITRHEGKRRLVIKPNGKVIIPLGFKLGLPIGLKCKVLPKSGIALKSDLIIPNSPGLVDTDYTGEVMLVLTSIGDTTILVEGSSICQLTFEQCPIINFNPVKDINDPYGSRGSNGHGSTGSALDGGLGIL